MKPRIFWCRKTHEWVHFTSWVRSNYDRMAEQFTAELNILNRKYRPGLRRKNA